MEKYKYSYIKGIDGLRAIAVLAVMFFHLNSSLLPGGFSGVDIFFVISGYVVSASMARHASFDFFNFAGSFYARRILRIFPALIICLLVSSLVSTLFIPASWLSDTSNKTGLAAFFGLANVALIIFDDAYFSPRSDFNPFTHTWSLAVEEQFYLIYPVFFFIWMQYKNKDGLTGVAARYLLAAFILLSFLYSAFSTSTSPTSAFYLLPSRLWELALGALLLHLHSGGRLIPSSVHGTRLYLLIGLLFITVGLIFSDKKAFPFPWAVLPVFGTLCLISGLISQSSGRMLVRQLLESQAFVYVGKISYSLYLWHWPVYVLFRWTSGLETTAEFSLALAISFILAVISYHFIEQPFRSTPLYRTRPLRQIIWSGGGGIAATALFAGLIFIVQPSISLSVTKDRKIWYPHPWAEEKKDAVKIFAGRKIFAIGDSHAGAYSTMLQKLADDHGVEIINMSAERCGIANLLNPKITKGKRCAEVFDNYLKEIKASASAGDIVFFASLRMDTLCNQWENSPKKYEANSQKNEIWLQNHQAAERETAEIIKLLGEMQLHVIIDAPKPVFASPPFRCSDWFNAFNPVCAAGFTVDRNFLLDHRRDVMKSLERLSDNFFNLTVWDPFPVLCSTEICSAFDDRNNKPLFFDGDHLSGYGNTVLYPSFELVIQQIW
jgi:peptidoglycan/LPS O-acetylase OafA/YrhL